MFAGKQRQLAESVIQTHDVLFAAGTTAGAQSTTAADAPAAAANAIAGALAAASAAVVMMLDHLG